MLCLRYEGFRIPALKAANHAGTATPALEKTATRQVDQQSTDLNTVAKIAAFTAAVQAAINELIAKINLFDGRITALENKTIVADTSSCSTYAVEHLQWRMCPAGMFVMGTSAAGITTGSKRWFGSFYCCKLKLQ